MLVCETPCLQVKLTHTDLVVIGRVYVVYPNGCRHERFIPAKARAHPVRVSCR